MPYGMYLSAAGADAQSKRLEVLSHNLANADTPGFKREIAVVQARHAEAIERGQQTPGSGDIDDVGGGLRFAETLTQFTPGPLRQTGKETDLAINGDGFFVVEKDGEQLLTRAGNFRFSGTGVLETDQGHTVLSIDGTPIVVDPGLDSRIIDGAVTQAGTVQYVALAKPQSLGDLVRVGENLFSPLAEVEVDTDSAIKSGHLELSGVKPAAEMMELINTSRAYEANIRMIQNHDHVIGSLVNRILKQ